MKPDDSDKSLLAEQLDQVFVRPSGREPDQMREVTLKTGIAPHANGSVLCSFGNTQVICAVMVVMVHKVFIAGEKVLCRWVAVVGTKHSNNIWIFKQISFPTQLHDFEGTTFAEEMWETYRGGIVPSF